MINNILLDPPNIFSWIGQKERDKCIILFDLATNLEDNTTHLRFNLNVVFNPIAISVKNLTSITDYYLGSTGAEIELNIEKGKIVDHTHDTTLNVTYTNSVSFKKDKAINIKPKVSVKINQFQSDFFLSEINRSHNEEVNFSTSFNSEERVLIARHLGNNIKWNITLPRGEKAIRDFLIGNLYLFASCEIFSEKICGYIKIHTSDVRFFDDQKRVLSKNKSVFMLFYLWKKGVSLKNIGTLTTNFEGTKNDI